MAVFYGLSNQETIFCFKLLITIQPIPCYLVHLRILGLASNQIPALPLFQTQRCHQLTTVGHLWPALACEKRTRDKRQQKTAETLAAQSRFSFWDSQPQCTRIFLLKNHRHATRARNILSVGWILDITWYGLYLTNIPPPVVWSPLLGPVSSEGVCPDSRVQSKLSVKDCFQPHKPVSNVHSIPWKQTSRKFWNKDLPWLQLSGVQN